MWKLYILLCDHKTYYVGITSNLSNRLFQHQNRMSKYTKRFNEITLIYLESYKNKFDAEKRETQIKGWSRAKKNALVNGNKSDLVSLSNYGRLVTRTSERSEE